MTDMNADINRTRAMRIAKQRIEGFAQQFGQEHRNLARHAAFPLVLTPDFWTLDKKVVRDYQPGTKNYTSQITPVIFQTE